MYMQLRLLPAHVTACKATASVLASVKILATEEHGGTHAAFLLGGRIYCFIAVHKSFVLSLQFYISITFLMKKSVLSGFKCISPIFCW